MTNQNQDGITPDDYLIISNLAEERLPSGKSAINEVMLLPGTPAVLDEIVVDLAVLNLMFKGVK